MDNVVASVVDDEPEVLLEVADVVEGDDGGDGCALAVTPTTVEAAP